MSLASLYRMVYAELAMFQDKMRYAHRVNLMSSPGKHTHERLCEERWRRKHPLTNIHPTQSAARSTSAPTPKIVVDDGRNR